MVTFKEAFREARNAGKKTFTWQGKSYTTELKEEAAARAPKTPVGAFRGQRSEGANEAPKKPSTASEDGGMMGRLRKAGLTPSGASEVGAGKSASAALGMAGGVAARGVGKALSATPKSGVSRAEAAIERVVGGRRAPTAAARTEPTVGRPVTTRLDDAAAAFSKPRAAEMTKSTAKEMPKAERVILKPVAKEAKRKAEEASRKKAMADEAKRIAEKKDDIVSKRMRSREQFAKGGSVTKRKK